MNGPMERTREFYAELRREVVAENRLLAPADQALLRSHYPVMMAPERYPIELAAAIYAERRRYPAAAIAATASPFVFDAGCGYGSESFFFASLGARVLAIDADADKIRIARQRQPYYEERLGRTLDTTFEVGDLDYVALPSGLSLTWLASVLAAVCDQDQLLERISNASRRDARIIVSDMNLWNPLFLFGEWRRRERGAAQNQAFRRAASFSGMVGRRARHGARYYPEDGKKFDDVQFFTPSTLAALFRSTGFRPAAFYFSGYVPPALARFGLAPLDDWLAQIPLLSRLGYFYCGVGIKD